MFTVKEGSISTLSVSLSRPFHSIMTKTPSSTFINSTNTTDYGNKHHSERARAVWDLCHQHPSQEDGSAVRLQKRRNWRVVHHRPPDTGAVQGETGRMAQRERTDELTEQVGRTQKAARLRFFHEQGARKKRSKRNRCSVLAESYIDKIGNLGKFTLFCTQNINIQCQI